MNSPTTKIAVFGAGSIGCYLGGLLLAQGVEVIFIGRERLKKAVKREGLTLTHYQVEPVHLMPAAVTIEISPTAIKDCKVILLCTKSQDTASAANTLRDYASPGAQIVSCQNGISNVPVLKETLGSDFKVSGAIIPYNVTPTGPASFHCGTGGALHFEHDLPQDIQTAFQTAGQEVKYGENFKGDQWAKLVVNLNNALNTLNGGTLRDAFLQKDYRLAFAKVVGEGLSVAQAKGVEMGKFNGRSPALLIKTLKLPNFLYKILMERIVKIDAKARSSMLDDLETGRGSEIDYLQGEIVRQGKALNVDISANLTILKAVELAFENGASPKLSGAEILKLIKGTS